jgi:DNA-binding YbaB/EbfC family protein
MQQNLGKLLKGIGELQKKVDAAQKEIGDTVFKGEAGGGLVKMDITGRGEVKALVIDPSLLTEDAETLADIIVVAMNKANEAKESFAKQKLSGMAGGLLPMGFKLPGFG